MSNSHKRTEREKIILKMLEICKQLYIDGMIHGIKHGRETIKET